MDDGFFAKIKAKFVSARESFSGWVEKSPLTEGQLLVVTLVSLLIAFGGVWVWIASSKGCGTLKISECETIAGPSSQAGQPGELTETLVTDPPETSIVTLPPRTGDSVGVNPTGTLSNGENVPGNGENVPGQTAQTRTQAGQTQPGSAGGSVDSSPGTTQPRTAAPTPGFGTQPANNSQTTRRLVRPGELRPNASATPTPTTATGSDGPTQTITGNPYSPPGGVTGNPYAPPGGVTGNPYAPPGGVTGNPYAPDTPFTEYSLPDATPTIAGGANFAPCSEFGPPRPANAYCDPQANAVSEFDRGYYHLTASKVERPPGAIGSTNNNQIQRAHWFFRASVFLTSKSGEFLDEGFKMSIAQDLIGLAGAIALNRAIEFWGFGLATSPYQLALAFTLFWSAMKVYVYGMVIAGVEVVLGFIPYFLLAVLVATSSFGAAPLKVAEVSRTVAAEIASLGWSSQVCSPVEFATPGSINAGDVFYNDQDCEELNEQCREEIRGRSMEETGFQQGSNCSFSTPLRMFLIEAPYQQLQWGEVLTDPECVTAHFLAMETEKPVADLSPNGHGEALYDPGMATYMKGAKTEEGFDCVVTYHVDKVNTSGGPELHDGNPDVDDDDNVIVKTWNEIIPTDEGHLMYTQRAIDKLTSEGRPPAKVENLTVNANGQRQEIALGQLFVAFFLAITASLAAILLFWEQFKLLGLTMLLPHVMVTALMPGELKMPFVNWIDQLFNTAARVIVLSIGIVIWLTSYQLIVVEVIANRDSLWMGYFVTIVFGFVGIGAVVGIMTFAIRPTLAFWRMAPKTGPGPLVRTAPYYGADPGAGVALGKAGVGFARNNFGT